jgi:geranylgeranyl diphosphate synthase, type II
MNDLASYLQQLSALIEEHLHTLIPHKKTPYHQLFDAARYSLLSGGKRLRPILTLATTQMLGGDLSAALTPACAIEMVHAYSLIHDDLPCMDDDDFRRGKPSLHKVFPEGHAVLTGDYLLTYAFEVLALHPSITPGQKILMISTLAQRAGGNGMIGGQVMDLENQDRSLDLSGLTFIHEKKTGAMISAAVEFGGIMAKSSEHHIESLHAFGEKIGLAFQIIDDILDVTASHAKHGRGISTDVLNQKTTYVTLLGIEASRKRAQDLREEAIAALSDLPADITPLVNIADFILTRSF